MSISFCLVLQAPHRDLVYFHETLFRGLLKWVRFRVLTLWFSSSWWAFARSFRSCFEMYFCFFCSSCLFEILKIMKEPCILEKFFMESLVSMFRR